MLALQARICQRLDIVQTGTGSNHQHIESVVVGVGGLHQVVALRVAHDDVAFQHVQRVAHEAHRARVIGVLDGFAEFLGEQFRQLVFEAFVGLIRKRHAAGIGADTQHFRIDQFHRTAKARRLGMRPNRHQAEHADRQRQQAERYRSSRYSPASAHATIFGRGERGGFRFMRRGTSATDRTGGTSPQIDIDRIDIAHDVLVFAERGHDELLRCRTRPSCRRRRWRGSRRN